jgi:hypothetical protein
MNSQYRLPIGIAYDLFPSSFKVLWRRFFSMGGLPDKNVMEVRATSEGKYCRKS